MRFNNKALELASSSNEDSGVIHKAPIKEFFDGEQHDLIVTVLSNALRKYTTDNRAYELLEAIIAANPECGNGREILATVKSVLSGGQAPRDSDFAKLRAVGFDVVSEQNHYKLRFMGNENTGLRFSKLRAMRDRERTLYLILRKKSAFTSKRKPVNIIP